MKKNTIMISFFLIILIIIWYLLFWNNNKVKIEEGGVIINNIDKTIPEWENTTNVNLNNNVSNEYLNNNVIEKENEIKKKIKESNGKLVNINDYNDIIYYKDKSEYFSKIYNLLKDESKNNKPKLKESVVIDIKNIKPLKGYTWPEYQWSISFEIDNIFNSQNWDYNLLFWINDVFYKKEELIWIFTYFNVLIERNISSNIFHISLSIPEEKKEILEWLNSIELKYTWDDFNKEKKYSTIYILNKE